MKKRNTPSAVPRYSRMIEDRFSAPIPKDTSHINHSFCTSYYSERISEGYSLKYVHNGRERYETNGQKHTVTAGNFLVVSNGSKCKFIVEEKRAVEGVCVYLSSGQVADVWKSLHQSSAQLLEQTEPGGTESIPDFFEHVFSAKHTVGVGKQLQQVLETLKAPTFTEEDLHEELFFDLAEELCLLQERTTQQVQHITARKKTTREELYRRLLTSRDYLHDNMSEQLNLSQLAEAASLSEFHFLRQFKAVFGLSPYQYLLQLRLRAAQQLLLQQGTTVASVAQACGFKEVQAFSKLFRKYTGKAPALYQATHFNKC